MGQRGQTTHTQKLHFLWREEYEQVNITQTKIVKLQMYDECICEPRLMHLGRCVQFEWGLFCHSPQMGFHLLLIALIIRLIQVIVITW